MGGTNRYPAPVFIVLRPNQPSAHNRFGALERMVKSQTLMKRDLQRTMYELPDHSTPRKLTLAIGAGLWALIANWLLLGSGLARTGEWFGEIWTAGDLVRRALLSAGFCIYYVRLLLVVFRFLRRGVSWSEVSIITSWLFILCAALAILGGRNVRPIGIAEITGIVLYAVGSWLHTYSEFRRDVWKRRPENRGRLYTKGLFRYAIHINYFGDLVLFTGLGLLTGSPFALLVPALMLAGFVFINIPVLDSHLHDKYGAAFDEYAARTHKLIPFVY